MENNIPSIQEINARYSVNVPGQFEGIRQSLFDFQTYPSAGQTSLQFFNIPKGQGGKTIHDTNMTIAGSLPDPNFFLVQSVELYLFPGDDIVNIENSPSSPDASAPQFVNDVQKFAQGGALDLFILSKSYLTEAPLGRFPPKTRLNTEFGFALQSNTAQAEAANQVSADYGVMSGRPYWIAPNVLLKPNQNFSVTLSWPTPVALNEDARVGVVLDGVLYRPAQ